MPSEFLDRLNQIGQQSVLGGTIRAASAFAMGKRLEATSKVVSNVNERIRLLESTDLQTVEERIDTISNDPEAKKEIDSVQVAAVKYQQLDSRIRTRQKEYEKIYGEAFGALGIIGGEAAGQASQILEGRLKGKVGQLSEELKAPLRQIQYEAALSSFEWDKLKYDDAITQRQLSKDAAGASEYLQSLPEWHDLDKGKLSFLSYEKLNKHNRKVADIKKATRDHFKSQGIELSDQAVELAFKNSADMSGLSWSWTEKVPKIDKTIGQNLVRFNNAYGALRHYSSLWRDFSPELKIAIQKTIRGEDPEEVRAQDGVLYDKKTIRNYAEIFGPVNDKGEASAYFTALGEVRSYDAANMGYSKDGEFHKELMNSRYNVVMIPNSPFGFADGNFLYEPEVATVPEVGFREGVESDELPFNMYSSYFLIQEQVKGTEVEL